MPAGGYKREENNRSYHPHETDSGADFTVDFAHEIYVTVNGG